MRVIILFLVLLFPVLASAQSEIASSDLFYEPDFETLMYALDNEDYNTAFTMASKLLDKSKTEDYGTQWLRYLYLEAAAGKRAVGSMSIKTLEDRMSRILGKRISTKPRDVLLDCGFNFNVICKGDNPNTLLSSASNKDGTTIHLIELYKNVTESNFQAILGTQIILSGVLESVEVNPNESGVWIIRATVDDVAAQTMPSQG